MKASRIGLGVVLAAFACVALAIGISMTAARPPAADARDANWKYEDSFMEGLATGSASTPDEGNAGGSADAVRDEGPELEVITGANGERYAAHSVLVSFDGSVPQAELVELLEQQGVEVRSIDLVSKMADDNSVLVEVRYEGDEDPKTVSERLASCGWAAASEPNYVMEICEDEPSEGAAAAEPATAASAVAVANTTAAAGGDDASNASLAAETGGIAERFAASGNSSELAGLFPVITNDPKIGSQWALSATGAVYAWDTVKTNHKVTVAVIDSGVDIDHPDLADNLVLPYARDTYRDVTGASYVNDQQGHGTHVAGIVAAVANNSIGVAGISYNANVLPVRTTRGTSNSSFVSDVVEALDYVTALKKGSWPTSQYGQLGVINCSFGDYTYSSYYCDAFQRAYNAGMVIVASAGNDITSEEAYPAAFPNVIGVSALKKSGSSVVFDSNYSNYGSYVDLSAPGTDIYSTTYDGAYGNMTGTSMAAPMVSGAAALVIAANPYLSPKTVESILEETANDMGSTGWDSYYGYGALQVHRAVDKATSISIREKPTWKRLGGKTRYDTMEAIVNQAFPGTSSCAVLVSGANFPDALSAASLAGAYDCPVVTTKPDALSAQAKRQLERLGVIYVIIVGGEAAVSKKVEQSVKAVNGGIWVERVCGSTRYSTALEVMKKAADLGAVDTVFVATGKNFPDALAASPYSYVHSAPIVLIDPDKGITNAQANAIVATGARKVVLLGGADVVPNSVQTKLKAKGIKNVVRLAGSTRYTTAIKVAKWASQNGADLSSPVVATGLKAADALAGAALAGEKNSVLLLVDDKNANGKPISAPAIDYLGEHAAEIREGYLLGGESALSKAVEDRILAATNGVMVDASLYGMSVAEDEPSPDYPASPSYVSGKTTPFTTHTSDRSGSPSSPARHTR